MIITDIDQSTLDQSLNAINSRSDRAGLLCDVSDPHRVQEVFEQVAKQYGRFDVLVNNAGIGNAAGDGFDQYVEALNQRQEQVERGEEPTVFAEQRTPVISPDRRLPAMAA